MMKPGAMLVNVSRGGLVESDALFEALESGQIGNLGLDVYEDEGDIFFVDHVSSLDTLFTPLLSVPAGTRWPPQCVATPACQAVCIAASSCCTPERTLARNRAECANWRRVGH